VPLLTLLSNIGLVGALGCAVWALVARFTGV
jgi:hypothetical protein